MVSVSQREPDPDPSISQGNEQRKLHGRLTVLNQDMIPLPARYPSVRDAGCPSTKVNNVHLHAEERMSKDGRF